MQQTEHQPVQQEPQSSPISMEQSGAHLQDVPSTEQKPQIIQEQAPAEQTTRNATSEKKSVWRRETLNSPWPWLLLTAPLLAGCLWLVNHSSLITANLDKPYALLAGPALIGSILAGWLAITFFKTITNWCVRGWNAFQRARREDSSAQFFWIVIVVFMVVSVFASGTFFTTIEHNAFPGLGYATALFIDLVAVQAMRARLNAVRMRNAGLSRLYLFGVLLCAGASAFANVYTSLANFDQHVTGQLPPWMLDVAPWFGLVFPAMILLLSITADATIDQISTRLDPEAYRERQAKQTKMLEYQRDALREQLHYEQEITMLSRQLQNRKEQRVFFLYGWLFPVRHTQNSNTQAVVTETLNQVRPWFQALEKKSEQAVTALQTTQQQASQAAQQKIAATDADLQLIIAEFLILKQTIEQQKNLFLSSPLQEEAARQTEQTHDKGQEQPNVPPVSIQEAGHKQESISEAPVEQQQPIEAPVEIQRPVEAPAEQQVQTENTEVVIHMVEEDELPQEQHTEELHITTGAISEIMAAAQRTEESAGPEKVQSTVKRTAATGPRTIDIAEVAERYDITIAVVKEAIKNNQLKLSKRSENKILTSSLKDFSPPRKRTRRPAKKLVEAEVSA